MLFCQILCGNKFDLDDSRVITQKEGVDLAKKLGIPFLETSAKSAHNVGEAFETLVKEIPKTQSSYKVCHTFNILLFLPYISNYST